MFFAALSRILVFRLRSLLLLCGTVGWPGRLSGQPMFWLLFADIFTSRSYALGRSAHPISLPGFS